MLAISDSLNLKYELRALDLEQLSAQKLKRSLRGEMFERLAVGWKREFFRDRFARRGESNINGSDWLSR
jgi:hypothetical protein